MLSHRAYDFTHDFGCPTDGWLTKQQMAALFGITVQHFDRRYRPVYSKLFYRDPDPPGGWLEGEEREVNGKLHFRAFDIFDQMNNDGLLDRPSGVRLHSIVCPACGRTIGKVESHSATPLVETKEQ